MKIAWYGPEAPDGNPSRPTPRQLAALQSRFGVAPSDIDPRGQLRNAAAGVADFRRSGADDLVVIAPLAVLDHVLREGVRPIWSGAEVVDRSHPEAEWEVKGRWFRFTEFKRLTGLELKTEPAQPLRAKRPAVVAWLTRHTCDAAQRTALQALYGPGVVVKPHAGELGNARGTMGIIAGMNADDVVIVAPLSLIDELTKLAGGTGPLHGVMKDGRFVEFRRVIGLELQYEAV